MLIIICGNYLYANSERDERCTNGKTEAKEKNDGSKDREEV